MIKKKIVYVLSSINESIAFEWISTRLDKSRFELSFIHLNRTEPNLHRWCLENGMKSNFVCHEGKSDSIKTSIKVYSLLRKLKPEIVHCHLFEANLMGLFTSKLLGVKMRLFTRHHSTFHHDYHPRAVLLDKVCNKLATHIVAISKNVETVLLREDVNPNKIRLINHGFDLEKFKNISPDRIENLRLKYSISKNRGPVIGVISRYINWKGHQYIIPAFREVLQKNPNALLIIANANGPFRHEIESELSKIPKANLLEITFEKDLFALYKLFDVFVHCPINENIEAFGQIYVEALAAEVPSVFTLSGIATEFVKDKKNALVVEYQNSKKIVDAISLLLEDENLRVNLARTGAEDVKQFSVSRYINELEELYAEA